MMKQVTDLLNVKGREVWSLAPDSTVYDAIDLMAHRGIGALLVMEGERLVGIVSERDYARKVILNQKASEHTRVSEIMTRDVIRVSREDTIDECLRIMKRHHIRHLPVVEEAKVLGMLSLRDLFIEVIEEKIGAADDSESA